SRGGETAIAISNVSPGAAYFLDPAGFGWVSNPAGSFGPGRRPLPAPEGLAISKGAEGDGVATVRFCEEVLRGRAPAIALLWLSEPDYTGHHTPLGSPAHRRAIGSADENVRRVAETVTALDSTGDNFLFVVGGHFAPGPRHARSSLIDIAPTVLRHLGLPATEMDGQSLPSNSIGNG